MSTRSVHPPRHRLLAHLSQAVETLRLKQEPGTQIAPLKGGLKGKVKVHTFQVNSREFDHFESISNALHRLDRGTYGECVKCGNRIQASILAQTPWASDCLGCRAQESQP